ncbi:hypothetical protein BZG36_01737 [Bifiguratus adelaidae]|uniref:AAA+ ATPase domain-containing protein n=1 Tax=Bifiguratus adelaidae TaxID=1938954 RepID=A0A261Y394_9FUNG|nr:hypothetical protein BZG36_01737 [Bifiguratus adelaidae]
MLGILNYESSRTDTQHAKSTGALYQHIIGDSYKRRLCMRSKERDHREVATKRSKSERRRLSIDPSKLLALSNAGPGVSIRRIFEKYKASNDTSPPQVPDTTTQEISTQTDPIQFVPDTSEVKSPLQSSSEKQAELIEISSINSTREQRDVSVERTSSFMTAKAAWVQENSRKGIHASNVDMAEHSKKRTMGQPPSNTSVKRSRFVSPLLNRSNSMTDENDELFEQTANALSHYNLNAGSNAGRATSKRHFRGNNHSSSVTTISAEEEIVDERLRNIDPKMIEMIKNEIMDTSPSLTWDDIAGLDHAKKTIQEAVTWPMLRPDIFTGLRGPPKGLLLFGPPGTGKTLIGKCIASTSGATFFSISSSSLTSKWIGDGEKMVRALFAVARCHQPAVVFVDEIDSLLTQRTDGEVEASRRIKTEFLIQFDGVGTTAEEDRILIVGMLHIIQTLINWLKQYLLDEIRPQEIDEAARRRFRKRLYIPLPERIGRHGIIENLLRKQHHDLSAEEIEQICDMTEGYSGSDMDGLCREAALGPIRSIASADIATIAAEDVRPINFQDFKAALSQVRASVSDKDLELYLKFNSEYGSLSS